MTAQALETVFKEQYGRLYTLAFRMTGTRDNAEDVLQTAFLNALVGIDGFREEASLGTWLYRIVMNASKKYNQEARKLPVTAYAETHDISEDDVFAHVASFGRTEDDVLIERTCESCLQVFMNCMPPKLRAVYTLRSILHFSVADTAEILDISPASVKVDLHRARDIARAHYEGRCSLVKPGSRCDCRAFAQYMQKSGRTHVLIDVEAIRRNEASAKTRFLLEMGEILDVDALYDSDPVPPDFAAFKERVKYLRNERSLSLLEG